MSRFFLFILVLLLVAVGAVLSWWAFNLPGVVTFPLGDQIVSVQTGVAIILLILAAGLMALGWWIITAILVLPGRLSKARTVSRARKANAALAEGLLAAEGGDAKEALRLARKAMRHADDERLKLLLEARAAEANDDWAGAERAWSLLTRLPGGQLAGLRGAASAASARGDQATAEARAREALELRSEADWPFDSLFDIEVARGDWNKALSTLSMAEKRGLLEEKALRRRRAVLHTARAVALPASEKQAAHKALTDALRLAPDFSPAAYHGARILMIDTRSRAAQTVLEQGWKARPHPALAQLCRRLVPQDSASNIAARLLSLAEMAPASRESRILLAELAMDEANWVDALRLLTLLVEENPTARLCLLMERALKGYGDPAEAGRWGRMAASASREPDWSDIDPRGGAFEFDQKGWARMVYSFGDIGELIHPRYESYGRELEAGRVLSLPYQPDETPDLRPRGPHGPLSPPLDYAPDND